MKILKIVLPILFFISVFTFQVKAQEKEIENEVFFIVEEMPEYPGGEEALRKDISELVTYPKIAKENGVSGKVYVTFVVDTNGKIIDPTIARGVDPVLDKEAIRVMGLLKTWKPGKQKGKAVNVKYTTPINFVLNGSSEKKEPIENKRTNEAGNEVFRIVEDMPEFPGGEEALRVFISKTVKYPADAVKEEVQGKVYVQFTVTKEGKVADAKIVRGVHPSLDKEALRVMDLSPKWKPGKQRGQAVNVEYTVPINFALK